MQIKYTHAFSLLEILLSLTLLSILSIFMLKPYTTQSLALRQANLHIQTLQQEINKQAYYAFLQKKPLNQQTLTSLLQNTQINTNLFSLTWQNNRLVLQIGKKKLNMIIRQTNTNHYVITCNPSHDLCRKIYHRKHAK
ncbi:hypothetical protein XJ32_05325 [Helicobacter bilis]|uniref:Prepilin-type N-terminal cleavage/methylation domain-containing protein n=1 Tax=Helicobacter bilis TaxID=37372 RepID=A0A1Q2LGP6_9HELI|nr:hypothetical protein [Helicobacter bilis]AQQ59604.1 hypothetical protein XJ32_05325 [Helicobacter bilis]